MTWINRYGFFLSAAPRCPSMSTIPEKLVSEVASSQDEVAGYSIPIYAESSNAELQIQHVTLTQQDICLVGARSSLPFFWSISS